MVRVKIDWTGGAALVWVSRVPCIGEIIYVGPTGFRGGRPPEGKREAKVILVMHVASSTENQSGCMVAMCSVEWAG